MTTPDNLKYVFEATFKDGSVFTQPVDDKHPDHDDNADFNPSAFRFVQDKIDDVVRFDLVGEGKRFSVDLKTGVFNLNGQVVRTYPNDYPMHTKKLQLIYYREVKRETEVTGTVLDDMSVEQTEVVTAHFISGYVIGWQVVGENYTQIIAVE